MTTAEAAVWDVVQMLNRAWTIDGAPERLAEYFHPTMVAITATDAKRLEGRDACVAGWTAFVRNTKIHFWKETEPNVQLYNDGQTAIVTYYFEMSFDMGGQTINLSGRDMFTLIKENEKWLVVADQFSPFPR